MSNDVSLKVLLLGEDKSASKALRGVRGEVDKTTAKAKTAGGVMKGALGAAVIAEASRAVYDFGKDSVEAYRDAAASQRQLDDAYKRFPAMSDVSVKALREQAAAIEAKTGADADDIAGGQAVLARYKLTGKQVSAMTPLLVDYAKRTGRDIPAASGTLGKAIMGNARAMKELGIKFKDTGDPAKNYELIMAGLKDKVGGFAASEATTLDGKLSILQTKFGNLQESVGEKLVPVILTLADGAEKLVGWIEKNASWLGPLAAGIGAAAAAVAIWTGYQWLLNASLDRQSNRHRRGGDRCPGGRPGVGLSERVLVPRRASMPPSRASVISPGGCGTTHWPRHCEASCKASRGSWTDSQAYSKASARSLASNGLRTPRRTCEAWLRARVTQRTGSRTSPTRWSILCRPSPA